MAEVPLGHCCQWFPLTNEMLVIALTVFQTFAKNIILKVIVVFLTYRVRHEIQ